MQLIYNGGGLIDSDEILFTGTQGECLEKLWELLTDIYSNDSFGKVVDDSIYDYDRPERPIYKKGRLSATIGNSSYVVTE